MSTKNKKCSYCGSPISKSIKMFRSEIEECLICENCIKIIASSYVFTEKEQENRSTETEKVSVMRPSEIKKKLDEYVVGQDEAKKELAVAVYNHYKRINRNTEGAGDEIEIQKSNILMIGPTGSGKTHLASTLAKILDVPFAIADATSLTQAGYVGEDVEDVIARLYQNSGKDIEKTQQGIVYIDEIDKIARHHLAGRDPAGEGVQQSLLKILEGTVARVPVRENENTVMVNQQQTVSIDTSNILFICSGAFDGIDKIIESSRKEKNYRIGFGISEEETGLNESQEITSADIVKYGFLPELVGRLPVITSLNPLDRETLVSILTKPKNAIVKQYQELLKMDGVKMEFTKEALLRIADEALEKEMGARGLKSIIEKAVKNVMFDIPDMAGASRVVFTEDAVKGGRPSIYDQRNKIMERTI